MCRKRILDPGLVGRFIFQGALDIDWVFNTANPGSPGLDFKNSIKGNLLLRFLHLCDAVYIFQIDQDLVKPWPDFEKGNEEVS